MSKKRLVILTSMLVVLAVWGLEAAAKKVTITYWGRITPEWKATYRDFEKQHPGIKIKESMLSRAWASTSEKFLTAIAAGNAPDATLQNSHQFAQFASQGVFYEISELIKRDKIKAKNWFPPQWKGTFFAGKQFALPGITDTRVFYYNKRLFREAGLNPENPPKTWNDLERITPKLTKRDSEGKIIQYGYIPAFEALGANIGNAGEWVRGESNGAKYLDPTGKKYIVDNSQEIYAVKWAVDFYDKYYNGAREVSAFSQATTGAAQDPFLTERLAMETSGNWMLWQFATIPQLDFGVTSIPIPNTKTAVKCTFSCGGMQAIPANPKHLEEAWTLIKWLTGPEGALSFAKNFGIERAKTWRRQQLPGEPQYVPELYNNRKAMEVLKKEYLPMLSPKVRAAYGVIIDSLEYTHSCAGLTGTAWGLVGLNFYNEMEQAFGAAVYGKMTPKEALTRANKNLNKALAEAWDKVRVK